MPRILGALVMLSLVYHTAYSACDCEEDEELSRFNVPTPCQPTCDEPKRRFCTGKGQPSCVCQKGFIREFDGGACIPKDNCKKKSCPENEILTSCVSARTCNRPNIRCDANCTKGCDCKPGFIREFAGGKCVKEETCGSLCESPKIFNGTNTMCKVCCEGAYSYISRSRVRCLSACKAGCQCGDGYLLEVNTGDCVASLDECPNLMVFHDHTFVESSTVGGSGGTTP